LSIIPYLTSDTDTGTALFVKTVCTDLVLCLVCLGRRHLDKVSNVSDLQVNWLDGELRRDICKVNNRKESGMVSLDGRAILKEWKATG